MKDPKTQLRTYKATFEIELCITENNVNRLVHELAEALEADKPGTGEWTKTRKWTLTREG